MRVGFDRLVQLSVDMSNPPEVGHIVKTYLNNFYDVNIGGVVFSRISIQRDPLDKIGTTNLRSFGNSRVGLVEKNIYSVGNTVKILRDRSGRRVIIGLDDLRTYSTELYEV